MSEDKKDLTKTPAVDGAKASEGVDESAAAEGDERVSEGAAVATQSSGPRPKLASQPPALPAGGNGKRKRSRSMPPPVPRAQPRPTAVPQALEAKDMAFETPTVVEAAVRAGG